MTYEARRLLSGSEFGLSGFIGLYRPRRVVLTVNLTVKIFRHSPSEFYRQAEQVGFTRHYQNGQGTGTDWGINYVGASFPGGPTVLYPGPLPT